MNSGAIPSRIHGIDVERVAVVPCWKWREAGDMPLLTPHNVCCVPRTSFRCDLARLRSRLIALRSPLWALNRWKSGSRSVPEVADGLSCTEEGIECVLCGLLNLNSFTSAAVQQMAVPF